MDFAVRNAEFEMTPSPKMSVSEFVQKCIGKLMIHEGFRGKVYRCSAGILTVGYGRNLEDRGLSKEESLYLLENDTVDSIKQCEKHLGTVYTELDDVRKMVLVMMAFNMGIHGLLGFKKTLSFIRQKDFENASKEMLNSRWAAQVKGRAKELSEMMRTGVL